MGVVMALPMEVDAAIERLFKFELEPRFGFMQTL